MLPLDVYLENESEIVQKATGLVGDLKETVGFKLLKRDAKSRVVVNFHGVECFSLFALFFLSRITTFSHRPYWSTTYSNDSRVS